MLTLLIMLIAAAVAAFFTFTAGDGGHWGWAIPAAIAAAFAVALPINLWIKKRLNAIFTGIQNALLASQEMLKRKVGVMQTHGIGGPKAMAQLEKEQADSVRAVLPMLDDVKPLQKWNLLAMKQANLLKGQLLYQIHAYDEARPLLSGAMVLDPAILCMQMVLQWKKAPEETKKLDKLFNTGIGRFKYDKATLIYALYSWILVKQDRITEAVAILDEGKKKTEDPVIAQNWEHLANKRLNRFSYAGLGEKWYALGLETPQPVRQRPQTAFGGHMSRGGFR